MSTKIELHIICISSEIMTKHHFKILPEHQLQNLDQTLKLCAPSLNKNLALRPNFTFQICNKLLSTHFSSSTWATVTTSTSFELVSSHARATSIKFTKQQLVSQWVSDKHSQWSLFMQGWKPAGHIQPRCLPCCCCCRWLGFYGPGELFRYILGSFGPET